jgi:hypothetical protein
MVRFSERENSIIVESYKGNHPIIYTIFTLAFQIAPIQRPDLHLFFPATQKSRVGNFNLQNHIKSKFLSMI